MAFDQSTRNRLQKFVSEARGILSEEFTRQLQATYGLDPKTGTVADVSSLTHLDNRQRQTAHILRETLAHYVAGTPGKGNQDRTRQSLDRIVREQAFTVLNRLAALRMAEARGFLLESIANGYSSKGFQLYKQLAGSALGETGDAYRNYLFSLFDEFSLDLAVLFDRHSAQGRLFPRESALLELLEQINHHEIEYLWAEDETIGWIYQYFNSQEERKKMRAESQAPRNSRELAVRNQFFTPRYVVEFLTDNTLGRIWYEMTQGDTGLTESCRYLVRRPTEIFLKQGEQAPEQAPEQTSEEEQASLSQEELLKQPVYIPFRQLKDPRSIRMLDPACGSMHFGLYAFDLFERIYLEAWQLETELGPDAFSRENGQQPLQTTFDSFEEFKLQIPKLIIEHNIHGVDIDPRAVQIAGLSLWQRAQRAWHQLGVKSQQRPQIKKSNIVCAEPMPGEKALLQEFTNKLNPPVLGQLLEVIFDKMQLAGEAGTLLKIEEEIQTAIAEAREQWQQQSGKNSMADMFQAEKDATIPQQNLGFDLRGIDDETFWDDAEYRILQALSDYADQAESHANQKRLFAEDAAKGFAFIDLCRKRFDVMLQNPPFGEAAIKSKTYVKKSYPSSSRDILQAFVERLLSLSDEGGIVGTLSARTGFFLGDSKHWRNNVVFQNRLSLFADLGLGVLDDALVEVAAYTIEKGDPKNSITYATRHLSTRRKETALFEDIEKINYSLGKGSNFVSFEQSLIGYIPDYTFAYWAPRNFINRYPSTATFKDAVGKVKQGIATADDFRFARLAWEVDRNSIGKDKRWVRFSKGGEYSPPYDDIHLLVDWGGGNQLRAFPGCYIRNEDSYYISGATYTVRTASAFAPKILPKDCIFSHNAQSWHHSDEKLVFASIAYMMCRVPQAFIELGVGGGDIATSGSAARRYTTAVIEGVPVKNIGAIKQEKNIKLIKCLLHSKINEISYDETSADFSKLFILQKGGSASEITAAVIKSKIEAKITALYSSYDLDNYVTELFTLDNTETNFVNSEVGVHPCSYDAPPNRGLLKELIQLDEESLINKAVELHGSKRYFTKKSFFVDRRLEILSHTLTASPKEIADELAETPQNFELRETVKSLISEAVGIHFGRWNIKNPAPNNRGPFEALPNVPPAGLDTATISNDYPVDINISGVSELSAPSGQGFLYAIKDIFEFAKGDHSESLIQECIEILGATDLYTYFANVNGFFSDHLSRYSKSRRQAPIYWPLQTPSGSYTLWVYYHRLNEQTLYTCVNDFVEPKLKSVTNNLNTLRNQSTRSRQDEKELACLTDLETELKNFRDELLRIAKFWKPNLNDGVQITAAPLWKLFQHKAWQKKLKQTWEKLEKGDYDWAHLACSIWPERVLRKCHQDRSLAIAHDVEDIFWHEVEVPVIRRGRDTGETKLEWQPKDLTDTELTELVNQTITGMK